MDYVLSLPSELQVNIFYLDHDPAEAARSHCDRHVVKMILESAQMLSTAWHELNPELLDTDIGSTDPAYPAEDLRSRLAAGLSFGISHYIGNQRIYEPTHRNHPSAVWARSSTGNYDWLWRLATCLLEEYTFRYGKQHASRHAIRALEFPPPACTVDAQSEPPAAMPDEAIVLDDDGYIDAVASYRNYYCTEKRPLLTYTRRPVPTWNAEFAVFKEVSVARV